MALMTPEQKAAMLAEYEARRAAERAKHRPAAVAALQRLYNLSTEEAERRYEQDNADYEAATLRTQHAVAAASTPEAQAEAAHRQREQAERMAAWDAYDEREG